MDKGVIGKNSINMIEEKQGKGPDKVKKGREVSGVHMQFNGCRVTIGTMFDIHDNNQIIINNGPLPQAAASDENQPTASPDKQQETAASDGDRQAASSACQSQAAASDDNQQAVSSAYQPQTDASDENRQAVSSAFQPQTAASDDNQPTVSSGGQQEKQLKQEKKRGQKRADRPREKYHGMDYPVFSKGIRVSDHHIIAMYQYLVTKGWLSAQTSQGEFLRLFSGKSNDCEIIWMGLQQVGREESVRVGVSALYFLFKQLSDEKLICSKQKVGVILESHFVDKEGHFLQSVSNVMRASAKAHEVIDWVMTIMRYSPNAEDLSKLLENEMG